MAVIAQLLIYPIKGLGGVSINDVRVIVGDGLVHDREWTLTTPEGYYINAKHCPKIHKIRLLEFVPPSGITLESLIQEEEGPVSFDLIAEHDLAESWFRRVLGTQLKLVRKLPGTPGFTDDPRFDGPTIVSQATLTKIENWFEIDDAAERFRPNIIVSGVDTFWEDLLVGEDPTCGSSLCTDTVELAAVYPVHRCVVPSRAPSTTTTKQPGKVIPNFIPRFQELRRSSFPTGAPVKRLTGAHQTNREAYHLCTACIVLRSGKMSVGDRLVEKGSVTFQEKLSRHPLSRKDLQKLVNAIYAHRELSRHMHLALDVMIRLLPVSLSGALLTSRCPDSVRKPTLTEVVIGFCQLLSGIFILISCLLFFLKFLPQESCLLNTL
eukprot:TRINITY_DN7282_c0_g3_i1.p1 TRINITY_DN7282_c0_g3~~TRINITY_DN7282_c0_g3_i1.p1  ORF type:complete len:407 (-),score=44.41 TRINITY_DN7282_c0_g3_i1:62-1198(-)